MYALVESLRLNFKQKYSSHLADGEYDARDVDRLMNSDKYAEAFIRHQNGVSKQAADMCHRAFKWRKEIGVNDLTDASFPEDLLAKGALFFRNQDRDENPILYLKIKEHKKNPASLQLIQKFLVYVMDREDKRIEGRQIVVLFDMTAAGLGNLDLDLIKFLITCFEEYFPDYLAYLLVFDMPWILNAAWKIIRAWLSEEAKKKVIFVRGLQILEYIDKENLFVHMGGVDDYTFKYEPMLNGNPEPDENRNRNHAADEEASTVTSLANSETKYSNTMAQEIRRASSDHQITVTSPSSDPDRAISLLHADKNLEDSEVSASGVDKKVTFSNEDPTVYTGMTNDSVELDSLGSSPAGTNFNSNHLPLTRDDVRRPNMMARDQSTFVGSFITIEPGQELLFTTHMLTGPKEGVYQAALMLTNPRTNLRTAYKVKTTSPEKYKVRPSCGLIKPGQNVEVIVYLTANSHDVSKDKFLVMAMEVEDGFISSGEIAELWRTVSKSKMIDHRLRCALVRPPVVKEERLKLNDLEKHVLDVSFKVEEVILRNKTLEAVIHRQYRAQKIIIGLLICFSLIVVVTTYQSLTAIQQITRNRFSCLRQ